jgi:hypothetical protein
MIILSFIAAPAVLQFRRTQELRAHGCNEKQVVRAEALRLLDVACGRFYQLIMNWPLGTKLAHQMRKATTPTVIIVTGIVLLIAMLGMYMADQRGYQTLPDGSRIKLLAVTSGKHHQVSWKLFSLNNSLRKYSREFGPYINPELTDVDTTSSVDCVVFWTRRIFTAQGVRPIGGILSDENGGRDRIAAGPNAFSLLRDRYNPTSDGVVQGWAVPCSSLLGRTLKLHLYERQEGTTGTVAEWTSFSTPNPLFGKTARQEADNQPQQVGRYTVQLAGYSSGVPSSAAAAGAYFEYLYRPSGLGREFPGTSITLQISGPDSAKHQVRAQQVDGVSAGGVSFSTAFIQQTTGPGTLTIGFLPSCVRDMWTLKIALVDEGSAVPTRVPVSGIRTSNELIDQHPLAELDFVEQWYYETIPVRFGDRQDVQLQVRCGPVSDERLLCNLSAIGDSRLPLEVASVQSATGQRIAFEREDPYTIRCWLARRERLDLQLLKWSPSTVHFRAIPEVSLPELTRKSDATESDNLDS